MEPAISSDEPSTAKRSRSITGRVRITYTVEIDENMAAGLRDSSGVEDRADLSAYLETECANTLEAMATHGREVLREEGLSVKRQRLEELRREQAELEKEINA